MVDALASGASVLRDVEVRVFSRVPRLVIFERCSIICFYGAPFIFSIIEVQVAYY